MEQAKLLEAIDYHAKIKEQRAVVNEAWDWIIKSSYPSVYLWANQGAWKSYNEEKAKLDKMVASKKARAKINIKLDKLSAHYRVKSYSRYRLNKKSPPSLSKKYEFEKGFGEVETIFEGAVIHFETRGMFSKKQKLDLCNPLLEVEFEPLR